MLSTGGIRCTSEGLMHEVIIPLGPACLSFTCSLFPNTIGMYFPFVYGCSHLESEKLKGKA